MAKMLKNEKPERGEHEGGRTSSHHARLTGIITHGHHDDIVERHVGEILYLPDLFRCGLLETQQPGQRFLPVEKSAAPSLKNHQCPDPRGVIHVAAQMLR